MTPETESALRSPMGFFVVLRTYGEEFLAQVVTPARPGEETMRVRRLGRHSELVWLRDVIEARRATREEITAAACTRTQGQEDSTTAREDGHRRPLVGIGLSSSPAPSLGTSGTDDDGGTR